MELVDKQGRKTDNKSSSISLSPVNQPLSIMNALNGRSVFTRGEKFDLHFLKTYLAQHKPLCPYTYIAELARSVFPFLFSFFSFFSLFLFLFVYFYFFIYFSPYYSVL